MIASQRGRVISSGFSTTTCLPARAACDRRVQVGAARGADADDVEAGVGEHRVEVVVDPALAAGQRRRSSSPFGRGPAERGHDPGAGDLGDRPGVELGDHPAADDPETVRGHARLRRCRRGPRRSTSTSADPRRPRLVPLPTRTIRPSATSIMRLRVGDTASGPGRP